MDCHNTSLFFCFNMAPQLWWTWESLNLSYTLFFFCHHIKNVLLNMIYFVKISQTTLTSVSKKSPELDININFCVKKNPLNLI